MQGEVALTGIAEALVRRRPDLSSGGRRHTPRSAIVWNMRINPGSRLQFKAAGDDGTLNDPSTESAEPTALRDLVDEASKGSFPASDPPSTWAGSRSGRSTRARLSRDVPDRGGQGT